MEKITPQQKGGTTTAWGREGGFSDFVVRTTQNYHFFDVAPRRMNSPICFEFELFFLNLFFETDECKLVLRSVAPETSSAAITWSGDAMETLKYKIGLLRLVIKLDRIFFVLQKWGKSEQIERDICVFTLL